MGDKDNKGLLISHIRKYVHELLFLQILVIWDETLRINTSTVLLFLIRMLLVRILAWMGTSDMVDDEFGFDVLES